MKKLLIFLFILISLSGCMAVSELKQSDIDNLLNKILDNDTSLVNTSSNGYKYYLPSGVELISSKNYNEKLYSNGDYYYLYVDLASYYYKSNAEFTKNEAIYYSEKLNYNDKEGYIDIEKINDTYKIDFVYNYAKIEAYVTYSNLKQSLINMSYILNSIEFNDSISSLEVGNINEQFENETYDFYTPKVEGNFIEYDSKYGNYEDETIDDSNNIGNEESE